MSIDWLGLWTFCIRNEVYLLGAIGWLLIILSYPVGAQLPAYAEY
jgi:hypothetical protein